MSLYTNTAKKLEDSVQGTFGIATGAPISVMPTVMNLMNQFHDLSRGHGPQLTANVNAAPSGISYNM